MSHINFIALPLKRPLVKHRPKGYWINADNRREWFINFAKEAGFDPTDIESWKKIGKTQILKNKVSVILFPPIFIVSIHLCPFFLTDREEGRFCGIFMGALAKLSPKLLRS